MKKVVLAVFLFILSPVISFSYTETFYVCNGGDGSLPETNACATAWSLADFRTAGNWDTDDQDDGKFGPNDLALVKDDGGQFRWSTAFHIETPGLSGKPITIQAESGDTPIFSGGTVVATWENEGGNLWYATAASNPSHVYFHESGVITIGDEKTAKGDMVEEYDCWYDSGNTRLYCYAATDPDARYTTVEATLGTGWGVRVLDKSYVVIDGITSRHFYYDGFFVEGSGEAHTTITIQNCVAEYNTQTGINVETDGGETVNAVTAVTVDSNTVRYNGGYGIYFNHLITNSTISQNIVYNNGHTPVNPLYGHHGISLRGNTSSSKPDGITIEKNEVYGTYDYDPADSKEGTGIHFDDFASTSIARYNYVHDNEGPGFVINRGTGNKIYTNLVIDNGEDSDWGSDSGIFLKNAIDSEIYNNLIYSNGQYGVWAYDDDSSSDNNLLKNNTIMDNGTIEVRIWTDASSNFVSDYNQIYHSAGGDAYLVWDAVVKTWAEWQSVPQDANGNNTNPLLTDVNTDDYTLQASSPCIDAGVDLGNGLNYGLDVVSLTSDWINTVTVADHDSYGAGWEMGAYVREAGVTITATDSAAAEESQDTGTFRISRSGSTSGALVVSFTLGGTASEASDVDEDLSGGTVTILDGNAFVDQTITPTDDAAVEGQETLTMTIAADGYTIGSPSQATIYIADNEAVEGEAGLVVFGVGGTGQATRDSAGTGSLVRQ